MKILIISSTHHWTNGWFINPEALENALPDLRTLGCPLDTIEVTTLQDLCRVLDTLDDKTLVWPNAYYVDTPSGTAWIQAELERRELPYIGNPSEALAAMLHKQQTQQRLHDAGVPVPAFIHLPRQEQHRLAELLEENNLEFPLAVKPTSESCSMGIKRVTHLQETEAHVSDLLDQYPQSEVILEAFLPSEDITCGYLELNGEVMLLPTYYSSTLMPGKDYMVERDRGVPPWGGDCIIMPLVEEPDILRQLQAHMPVVVSALNIRGLTRADARLDTQGQVRFFDVNGMPALTYPKSVLVRQVRECFPTLDPKEAYRRLVTTVILQAAYHFGFTPPAQMEDYTLFNLTGGHVLRHQP